MLLRFIGLLFIIVLFLNGGINKIIKNFNATDAQIKDGAIILKKVRKDDIAAKKTIYYYLIAILNDKAAFDYSQIEFPFNSYYVDAKLKYARVIDKNGNIKKLQKDAVLIKSSPLYNYDDTKIISFSLPSVKKNTFIEFEIEEKIKKDVIPHEFSIITYLPYIYTNFRKKIIRIDTVKEASFELIVPKKQKIYFKASHNLKKDFKEVNNTLIYSWKLKDFNKISLEPAQLEPLDDIVPNVIVSSMKSWSILNNYFYKKYAKASTPSKKIVALTKKIIKNSTTKREKIVAIYNYIQNNFKYIFAHLGRGGMLPHKADEILNNGYGDCKDQTTLLIAMLKAANIKAYAALVNTQKNHQDYKIVSEKYFNHVITYIPKENLWLDSVGYKGKFPGISWKIAGSKAFVLNEKGGEFKTIPNIKPQIIKVSIDFNLTNDAIIGRLHYKLPSQYSNLIKSFLANVQNFKVSLENQIKNILNAQILSFTIKNSDNVNKNIEYVWDFKITKKISMDKFLFGSLMRNVLALSFPITELKRPKERIWGFRYGFLLGIDISYTIHIPKNFTYSTYFPNFANNNFYDYDAKIEKNSNTLTISEHFFMKKRKIPKKEYKNFYKAIENIFNMDAWKVVLIKKANPNQSDILTKKAKSQKDFINLANYYIDKSNYQKAKELLEKALKRYPKSAKLHHLYGVVLGYMDMFDASDKEFEIAKKLGYKEEL